MKMMKKDAQKLKISYETAMNGMMNKKDDKTTNGMKMYAMRYDENGWS